MTFNLALLAHQLSFLEFETTLLPQVGLSNLQQEAKTGFLWTSPGSSKKGPESTFWSR